MNLFAKLFSSIVIFLITTSFCFAENSTDILKKYYAAINTHDLNQFLSLMDENVIHDINQGDTETGVSKLKTFMQKDFGSFNEKLYDIIIYPSHDGKHFAAQWMDHGTYYSNYPGLPIKARNQQYTIRGGQFFEIDAGKITRITTYFNEADFLKQLKQ